MLAAALALCLSATPVLTAEKTVLPNGLTLLLSEDHRVPGVAVVVTYRVGSRDEPTGRSGFAHLFEHLMFMGSAHAPYPTFDAVMEAHGGQNNADTGVDRTRYFEWGPANLLETFLWLEADRLATLPEVMTGAKLDAQRKVVLEERREDVDNAPYGRTEVVLPENLFPPGHPYHASTLGDPRDLQAASLADVVRFFRDHYTAANAILTVVGDFDPAQARAWVQRDFGDLPRRAPTPRPSTPAAPLAAPRSVDLAEQVELPKAVLAWHTPPDGTPGDAAADLLAHVLAGTRSSRLYRALVYQQRLAQDVSADEQGQALGSVFTVELLASPGQTAGACAQAADAVLHELAETGPTPDELRAAKLDVRTRVARAMEPLLSRALLLARLEEAYGDPNTLDRELGRYEAQTVESIRDAARALLAQPRVTLTFSPKPKVEEPK